MAEFVVARVEVELVNLAVVESNKNLLIVLICNLGRVADEAHLALPQVVALSIDVLLVVLVHLHLERCCRGHRRL